MVFRVLNMTTIKPDRVVIERTGAEFIIDSSIVQWVQQTSDNLFISTPDTNSYLVIPIFGNTFGTPEVVKYAYDLFLISAYPCPVFVNVNREIIANLPDNSRMIDVLDKKYIGINVNNSEIVLAGILSDPIVMKTEDGTEKISEMLGKSKIVSVTDKKYVVIVKLEKGGFCSRRS